MFHVRVGLAFLRAMLDVKLGLDDEALCVLKQGLRRFELTKCSGRPRLVPKMDRDALALACCKTVACVPVLGLNAP